MTTSKVLRARRESPLRVIDRVFRKRSLGIFSSLFVCMTFVRLTGALSADVAQDIITAAVKRLGHRKSGCACRKCIHRVCACVV